MNKKTFFAAIIGAALLAAGIAAHGYFTAQQGVYYLQAQEESFLRAFSQQEQSPDDRG